jgi:hypothetical protein
MERIHNDDWDDVAQILRLSHALIAVFEDATGTIFHRVMEGSEGAKFRNDLEYLRRKIETYLV